MNRPRLKLVQTVSLSLKLPAQSLYLFYQVRIIFCGFPVDFSAVLMKEFDASGAAVAFDGDLFNRSLF
ncbi:MAG: hypothetical protein HF978_14975 [Desulfobacteraceae bacterium]|nr:hypothetical protein [Desulfobacteraceae bacterium]MBC2756843.1 hypothetical protein [Desulfobacteraceae bacterium]